MHVSLYTTYIVFMNVLCGRSVLQDSQREGKDRKLSHAAGTEAWDHVLYVLYALL